MTATKAVPLDWKRAQAQAYALLIKQRGKANDGAADTARFALDGYWSEPLQRAALHAIERWRSGKEEPPSTTEALAASLARHARHLDDNRRLSERTRARSLANNAERAVVNFCGVKAVRALDALCARELFDTLLERLFEVPDPDIPRFLDAWLVEGIDYDDNQGFAAALKLANAQAAHNIKRRIKYHALKIMSDLGVDEHGDMS